MPETMRLSRSITRSCDLCAHERDWRLAHRPMILEVIGESMGLQLA